MSARRRRLNLARLPDYSGLFRKALADVEREDRARAEIADFLLKPQECTLCRQLTHSTATRITGYENGVTRLEIMHLCRTCRESGGVEKLEAALEDPEPFQS
jgi:hypothetical protein